MSAIDTTKLVSTLRAEWPVERLVEGAATPELDALIAIGLMYREPVGYGFVRYGLTPAGRAVVTSSLRPVCS